MLDPYRTQPVKLTSTPYPEILIEGMTVGAALVKISIYGWLPLELTASLTALSGELRTLLKATDASDSLDVAVSALSGELRQLLKSYDFPGIEGLDMSVALVSGTLQVLLIQYTNWDPSAAGEELDMAIAPISGTLA